MLWGHLCKAGLPGKGTPSSCGGKQEAPWPEAPGDLTSPPAVPPDRGREGKGAPGRTGQKRKPRDGIYSEEHLALLLVVLIPWEDSFFFPSITLQAQIRTESSSLLFGPPTARQRAQSGAGDIQPVQVCADPFTLPA